MRLDTPGQDRASPATLDDTGADRRFRRDVAGLFCWWASVVVLAQAARSTLGPAALSLPVAAITSGLAVGVGVLHATRRQLLPSPFGAANTLTAFRAALAALIAGWLAQPQDWLWVAGLLGILTTCLDGVDGYLARRTQTASRFGARFDMETDAATVLVLSVLVWTATPIGAWVLSAGLLRYAFAGLSRWLPWLGAPLAPSRRRKAVCVVQGLFLSSCLLPLPPAIAAAIAGVAVTLLWISFGIDVVDLARRRPSIEHPPAVHTAWS